MLKEVTARLFLKTPVEFYVLWLGYFAIVWTFPLLTNPNLFNIEGFEIYRDINPYLPFWAGLYFTLGTFGVCSTVFREKIFTQISCLILFMLWLFTTLAFTVDLGINTGTMIYGTFAAVAFWNFIRAFNYTYKSWI